MKNGMKKKNPAGQTREFDIALTAGDKKTNGSFRSHHMY